MPLLEVEQLSVAFGNQQVVSDVSFTIARGERFGIIGESGSGKTLTALAITALLPDGASMGGSIKLDGVSLPGDEKTMARLRGKRFGMVFQEPMTALNPLLRIGAQIAEAVALDQPGAGNAEVPRLLEEVGLEPRHASRFAHQLSGGQRQRAMIAMALANQPDLLIADEPTSALDLVTQRRVLDLLGNLCLSRNMALLFISHDLKAVGALCTRAAVMHQGRLVETGTTQALFTAPRQDYTRRLVDAAQIKLPTLARPPVGATLLRVESLSRVYRHGALPFCAGPPLVAVDGVSLELRQGESLALVGPSGCGKTSLARIIAGLDRASSGQLVLDGQRYHGADLPNGLRRDVSLVFQDPFGSFDPQRRIGTSLAEPLRLEPALSGADKRDRVAEAIRTVGLSTDMLDRHPHEFSGGQRQRLAIARALITRPKLVLLDEPVSALDMSVRGDILNLLTRLQAEFGLTYLLISHDLDLVRAVADRVLVMQAGRIIEEGAPAEIFAAPRERLTQELVNALLPELGASRTRAAAHPYSGVGAPYSDGTAPIGMIPE